MKTRFTAGFLIAVYTAAPLFRDMLSLKANDLSKRFGHLKVFSGIAFELTTGESIALVGRNGSGKSTLVMTLLGQYRPNKGSVEYLRDGKPMDESEIRRQTALVSPYLNLYDQLSAEENLKFFAAVSGASVTGKHIDELLNLVGLAGRGSDLVGGYSSGMKQRLKYAVALLKDPGILFLDEPTSNLDSAGREIVRGIIERDRDKRIVVIATNETGEYDLASRRCELG